MKVTLERKNDAFWFQGTGKNPVPINIDNGENGASPMELLLMAVGSCSAIDIVSILKKQRQEITNYSMEVLGERVEVEQAKPFQSMHVTIFLKGNINPAKAKKAADLSFQKYCSVSLTIEPQVPVTYSVYVNGEKAT